MGHNPQEWEGSARHRAPPTSSAAQGEGGGGAAHSMGSPDPFPYLEGSPPPRDVLVDCGRLDTLQPGREGPPLGSWGAVAPLISHIL